MKKKIVILIIVIILLVIAGLGCYYFFNNKNVKEEKKSNSTVQEKTKNYIFAYMDYDYNIKLLDEDNKVVPLKINNVNYIMNNGLKYDNNKLYYLDKDEYIHSIDLKTNDFKDTKYDVKIKVDDATSSGVKTFFVKDGFIAYIDGVNSKAVKVDLNTGKEVVITNNLIKKATFTYYNLNNDSVYLDMNNNLYDPYKLDIVNNKGLVEELSYHLDEDYMNEDYFTVYNNDKGTCVYNAKTKDVSNCVKSKVEVIDENNRFKTILYKDTIVYLHNDKIYMVENGKDDQLLFTIDDSIENKDDIQLFASKDGVILAAGKTISCQEGCSYNYKYYMIKDGSAVEIDDLSGQNCTAYVVID